jgi:hypothetical protein
MNEMNDVFSARRFGWLMRKTVQERPAQVIGTIGLCFAISFICYGMTRLLQGIWQAQNTAFIVGLVLGGPFLASVVLGYFSNNAMGASFLTLPASRMEKWLSAVLIVGVLYFFIFLLFFRLMDLAFVSQFHNSLDPYSANYREMYENVHTLSFTEFPATHCYVMFFNFTGLMLIGSLFYNKAPFIKTSLVICTVIIAAFLFNFLIVKLLINNTQSAFPLSLIWIWVGKDRAMIQLSPKTAGIIKFVFQFALPVVLWSLSLLRLKEKEF